MKYPTELRFPTVVYPPPRKPFREHKLPEDGIRGVRPPCATKTNEPGALLMITGKGSRRPLGRIKVPQLFYSRRRRRAGPTVCNLSLRATEVSSNSV